MQQFLPLNGKAFGSGGYAVNYINQEVTWITNSANGAYDWYASLSANYYQDSVYNSLEPDLAIANIFISAANAAGIGIPNAKYFLQLMPGVIQDQTIPDGYQVYENAGTNGAILGTYYNTLGYNTGPWYAPTWVFSYWFGDWLTEVPSGNYGNYITNPVNNLFEYSVSYGITPGGSELVSGYSSIYFVIGEYQYKN